MHRKLRAFSAAQFCTKLYTLPRVHSPTTRCKSLSKANAQGWELKRQNEAAWLASSREGVQECKGEAVQMQPLSSTGKLPQGTKLLKAAGSSFLIAPLGHLRDETYSIYFNFRH